MVPDPGQVAVLDPSRLGVGPAHPGHEVVAAVLQHAVFPDVVHRAAKVVAHDVERVAGMRGLQLQREAGEFRVARRIFVGLDVPVERRAVRVVARGQASRSIFLSDSAMNSYLPDCVCRPSR